ncbi:hypothetical protein QE152_g22505 [Popillia japonica]|uniref:Polyprotein n=1 Tax=Popillia japonica TaxID=7064 RepID=A0AAW1KKG6_POPJA
MVSKLSGDPTKWDEVLDKVEFAMNNTVCRSTGNLPSTLLFGVNQTGDTNDMLRVYLESLQEKTRDLDRIRDTAEQNIINIQMTNEHHYNKKRKEPREYHAGDLVVIENRDVTAGANKKLLPKYRGPYVAAKVLDGDRYLLKDIEGFQLTQIPYDTIIGPDLMKPWLSDN